MGLRQDVGTNTIVAGGKAIRHAPRGILMLDALVPGDMGSTGTWPCPMLYCVVKDGSHRRLMLAADEGLLPVLLAAAADQDAGTITMNCASR
jgi:hypothetical protein